MSERQSLSRHQRRTERTRARLLDAARAVFLERGYDKASLGEITERADVGTGTFYLYFRDKRSVYEAMVRRGLFQLRQRFLEQQAEDPHADDPVWAIEALVRLVIEALIEDPAYARLVLCDGPPVESWLTEELGHETAELLHKRVADQTASLVVGAALAASRLAITRPRGNPTKRLIIDTAAFCSAGVRATEADLKKRRG